MNLFGFKSRRVSRRSAPARPVRWWDAGGPMARVPLPYTEQARAAFLSNPVAQRCAMIVADAVGGAPLTIDDAALRPLFAARSGGVALLRHAALHLLLHGNAYIQIIPGGSDGRPGELFALRPERVSVETDAEGWPVAYTYRSGPGVRRLAAEDEAGRPAILHLRNPHPTDDHYGAAPLSAAAQAVAVHNAAAQWNLSLLSNAARPSGALVHEPGEHGAMLSDDQIDRLRAELSAQYQGSANAGRPMLLEGGLKWQAMSLSPAEMDFLRLKDSAARDIATAFGVPPMLAGIPGDATYANFREASRALWRLTVLPLADAMLAPLATALSAWGASGRLQVDLDRVPALSEDRERLWAQVAAAPFLSDAEKRVLLDIDDSDFTGAGA